VVNGYAVAQLFEALSYKVAGSIPDGFTGIFHWHNHSGPNVVLGVDHRNEYPEYFLRVKVAGA
jgi:hypothetical protein